MATPITMGTKILAILSTNCWTGALLPWASCTRLMICERKVSFPTFSAVKWKLPFTAEKVGKDTFLSQIIKRVQEAQGSKVSFPTFSAVKGSFNFTAEKVGKDTFQQ